MRRGFTSLALGEVVGRRQALHFTEETLVFARVFIPACSAVSIITSPGSPSARAIELPNAGHNLALHRNATDGWASIDRWLDHYCR